MMLSRIPKKLMISTVSRAFSVDVQKLCQTGILPEGSNSGYFGTFKLDYARMSTPEGRKQFVDAVKGFEGILKTTSSECKTKIVGTVSFSKKAWETLSGDNASLKQAASKIMDFPGYGSAPATQEDVYLHIHSKKDFANFEATKLVLNAFNAGSPLLATSDEKSGFVYKDSRDLTGFIDGTENPHGNQPRVSAALNADGSSYVMVQRFIHNLAKWEKVDAKEQEKVIGRTKPDSVQLDPLPKDCHVARADVKENGKGLKIVRHSLPYGTPGSQEKGLWFTAYCHDTHNLEEIERSMFGLRDSVTDRILQFITPVTGGYYFVPSLEQIKQLK